MFEESCSSNDIFCVFLLTQRHLKKKSQKSEIVVKQTTTTTTKQIKEMYIISHIRKPLSKDVEGKRKLDRLHTIDYKQAKLISLKFFQVKILVEATVPVFLKSILSKLPKPQNESNFFVNLFMAVIYGLVAKSCT